MSISTEDKQKIINCSLLEGAVVRTGTLYYSWSVIGLLYGFLSFELFKEKIPDLSLFDNVWPRIIYSSIPLFIVGYFFRANKNYMRFKYYISIIISPLALLSASLVYAWPLFWKGHYDFYLQFHAVNIIVLTSTIFIISASPLMVVFQCLSFLVFYFSPLIFLFSTTNQKLMNLILSDFTLATIVLILSQKAIHKLRLQIAEDEFRKRHKASLFLGKHVSDAIYNNNQIIPDDFKTMGLVMSIDLRGFTKFNQQNPQPLVKEIVQEYHNAVNKILSKNKAYLHKTMGDGILISFGVMDSEVDLSDLPESKIFEEQLDLQKKKNCIKLATNVFVELSAALESLYLKHQFTSPPMTLGAGCDFGLIEVFVHGDDSYRQEMDIQGLAVIKAVRLESFTKNLLTNIDESSSYFICPPNLSEAIHPELGFKTVFLSNLTDQVRDFNEIKTLSYRQWKHKLSIKAKSEAA